MQPTSEKWEVIVGKERFIINGKEKDMLLQGIKMGTKVVQFRDLIINPAFIQSIRVVERKNPNQIESPQDKDISPEQLANTRKRLKQMRNQFPVKPMSK